MEVDKIFLLEFAKQLNECANDMIGKSEDMIYKGNPDRARNYALVSMILNEFDKVITRTVKNLTGENGAIDK